MAYLQQQSLIGLFLFFVSTFNQRPLSIEFFSILLDTKGVALNKPVDAPPKKFKTYRKFKNC